MTLYESVKWQLYKFSTDQQRVFSSNRELALNQDLNCSFNEQQTLKSTHHFPLNNRKHYTAFLRGSSHANALWRLKAEGKCRVAAKTKGTRNTCSCRFLLPEVCRKDAQSHLTWLEGSLLAREGFFITQSELCAGSPPARSLV